MDTQKIHNECYTNRLANTKNSDFIFNLVPRCLRFFGRILEPLCCNGTTVHLDSIYLIEIFSRSPPFSLLFRSIRSMYLILFAPVDPFLVSAQCTVCVWPLPVSLFGSIVRKALVRLLPCLPYPFYAFFIESANENGSKPKKQWKKGHSIEHIFYIESIRFSIKIVGDVLGLPTLGFHWFQGDFKRADNNCNVSHASVPGTFSFVFQHQGINMRAHLIRPKSPLCDIEWVKSCRRRPSTRPLHNKCSWISVLGCNPWNCLYSLIALYMFFARAASFTPLPAKQNVRYN